MKKFEVRGRKEFSETNFLYGLLLPKKNGTFVVKPMSGLKAKIHPQTIERTTEISDKLGTTIFQGDVIRFGKKYGLVVWVKEDAMFKIRIWQEEKETNFEKIKGKDIEIIGNSTKNQAWLKHDGPILSDIDETIDFLESERGKIEDKTKLRIKTQKSQIKNTSYYNNEILDVYIKRGTNERIAYLTERVYEILLKRKMLTPNISEHSLKTSHIYLGSE
jgi:predicted nucleotidyltransferase